MTNRLAQSTSPYLLQHAENPVDWYPWGEEAFEKARREDKPIFLSIGYAACHWCHVMAHESFEDPQTAALLNRDFVAIKVDREERPDLDGVFMDVVVAMTGQGGWPMSIFLSAQGEPFFAGTYFPPEPRYGMPAFPQLLAGIRDAWDHSRAQIQAEGQNLIQQLAAADLGSQANPTILSVNNLEMAAIRLVDTYDWENGGWGHAPKFPQPLLLEFLLRIVDRGSNPEALRVVRHCLDQMSKGGMYDVVGGGFHRYSTDEFWRLPHFEKMLYDNAQLAQVYLRAYTLTGDAHDRTIATGTLDYLLGMAHPQGGFYSSQDADSEGVEGKYYLWSWDDLRGILAETPDYPLFATAFGLDETSSREAIILQQQVDEDDLAGQPGISQQDVRRRLDDCLRRLRAVCSKRVPPATDDKILAGWNGLALQAFADAARYLDSPVYLKAAQRCAAFLLDEMMRTGRLYRSWRAGVLSQPAFLEDYTAVSLGLLSLYQADANPRWYQAALHLFQRVEEDFTDAQGGYFDSDGSDPHIPVRPKGLQDNPTPSGNALAGMLQLILGEFSGDTALTERGARMIGGIGDMPYRYPTAFGAWLCALDQALGPVYQIAILGHPADPSRQALVQEVNRRYRPRIILACAAHADDPQQPALLNGRSAIGGRPTAYVCQGFVCKRPVHTPIDLRAQLDRHSAD